MKKPLTLEQYLGARVITDPIHLFDCVMPCAGADAFLVMSESRARALKLPHARILSTIERHNAWIDDPIQTRGWTMDVDELYGMAGCAPADMDFLQAYDDYPVINLMQMEDLGFCARTRDRNSCAATASPSTAASRSTPTAASCPSARPRPATWSLTEALRQLTGTAGGTQVADARVGMVSGFGMISFPTAGCAPPRPSWRGATRPSPWPSLPRKIRSRARPRCRPAGAAAPRWA